MGCYGGDIEPPAVGVVVEAPGGGSGQKRAPGSRVWEGARPERGPSHHHTPLRIVGG
jgi:hypothetical protein